MKRRALLVTIFVLSLFIGCDQFKSKELSPEKKLELAEKCSKAGKTYFNEFRNTMPEASEYLWDDPEYHYSTHLNTCLIHVRYVTMPIDPPSYQYNQVIDIFSNKAILYGWFTRDVKNEKEELLTSTPDSNVSNYTSNEYCNRKDKLFKE